MIRQIIKKRRKTFGEITVDKIPYPKKTKMISELQSTVDDEETIDGNTLK